MAFIERILQIQADYNNYVNEYAELLKIQFDIEVNITILRILFRESEQNLSELELQMFQQDLEYFEIKKIDEKIIHIQEKLELLQNNLKSL